MEVKVGDVIYNKKEEYWCDNVFPGNWHKIKKFEKFEVIHTDYYRYCKKITIRNINENYNIYMSSSDLEDFYTKKDVRKIKLKEIGKEN